MHTPCPWRVLCIVRYLSSWSHEGSPANTAFLRLASTALRLACRNGFSGIVRQLDAPHLPTSRDDRTLENARKDYERVRYKVGSIIIRTTSFSGESPSSTTMMSSRIRDAGKHGRCNIGEQGRERTLPAEHQDDCVRTSW